MANRLHSFPNGAVGFIVWLDAFIDSPKVWRNLRSVAIMESSKRDGFLFVGRRQNSERFQCSRIEFVDKIVVTDPPSAADDRGWFTGSFALRKADATT